jgi:hypothetical protein
VVAPVRLLVATLLLKHGDAPEAFVEEWERVRRLFRRLRVPRSGAHEILSMCVLRHCRGLTPIGDDAVERMRALHRALARKRRWVTGREHLPLAALLGGEEGAPENIAADIDGNFRALGTRLWRGRVLLTTSIVLRLAHLEPADATDRMREMTAALERARIMVLTDRYDEIALLCLLSLPAERVVERVVEIERRLAEMRTAPFWSQRFNLAASLAFLELMHGDPGAVALADIKTVLDMQELVDQAAAAGAV